MPRDACGEIRDGLIKEISPFIELFWFPGEK